MHYGTLLISKAIDANDPKVFTRFGVTAEDFPTDTERRAYRFIEKHAEQNRNQAPSYATLVSEIPDFGYVPEVTDSYEYLTRKIKNHAAKTAVARLFDKDIEPQFDKLEGNNFLDWLIKEAESIKMRTNVRGKIGTDVKQDSEKFTAELDRRKAGESFRTWKSKFPIMPDYISGNLYVPYGKSGRGKSVITLEEAIEMAFQGANVLIWAMEMGWYEVLVRIYVSISARRGLLTTEVNGINMDAGFDSGDLRNGKLSEEFDVAFRAFLAELSDLLPGNITVRGVDDEDFGNRSLKALEADILATKADVVVVDPFYYLDYESNTSKTAGGDAANTSMKLRRLAGQTQTVIFAITQADETSEEKDEDGGRELQMPERKDVKKTKQLLEDAYLLIGVDTDYKQQRGIIGINKGRDGGEGDTAEIIYIPQVGIVKQPDDGAMAAAKFGF